MTRLTGRFDGRVVVLDDPQAIAFPPETQVELFVLPMLDQTEIHRPTEEDRRQALEELRQANQEFWSRQSAPAEPAPARWTRDDLYDEVV